MRISDWSSDVCSSDLFSAANRLPASRTVQAARAMRFNMMSFLMLGKLSAGQWSGLASIVRLDQLRSEEHTSELQSLMRISYAVFCLKKKINSNYTTLNA